MARGRFGYKRLERSKTGRGEGQNTRKSGGKEKAKKDPTNYRVDGGRDSRARGRIFVSENLLRWFFSVSKFSPFSLLQLLRFCYLQCMLASKPHSLHPFFASIRRGGRPRTIHEKSWSKNIIPPLLPTNYRLITPFQTPKFRHKPNQNITPFMPPPLFQDLFYTSPL